MAEPEGEDRTNRGRSSHGDRTESLSTAVAVLWVSIVALVDAVFGGKFGLIGFLAIGPFIAAAFAGVRRTALVGLYATFFSLVLQHPATPVRPTQPCLPGPDPGASSGVAIWIAYLRTQRSQQLRSARTETRIERRRRVAAETAQSMQALARALTTAADPAQVADAVFGALRDELQVDAAIFATTNDRGVLCVHRRFGYEPGRVRARTARRHGRPTASWATSCGAGWPSSPSPCPTKRRGWSTLAASHRREPIQLSGRGAPGRLRPRRRGGRGAMGPAPVHLRGRQELPVHHHRRGRPGGRARPGSPLTEFANLERSQHLHHLSSALAAATTSRRRGPRGRRRGATRPGGAFRRVPRASGRRAGAVVPGRAAGTLPCSPRDLVPVDGTRHRDPPSPRAGPWSPRSGRPWTGDAARFRPK